MRIGELAGIYPEHIHLDAKIPYYDLKYQGESWVKEQSIDQAGAYSSERTTLCRTFVFL